MRTTPTQISRRAPLSANLSKAAVVFAAAVLLGHCGMAQSPAPKTPASAGGDLSFSVKPAPEYDRLFFRETGWTGGDVASSVPLDDGRILWLFGDSWIGKIKAGRHVDAKIVSNTVALQRGGQPDKARLVFYSGGQEGKETAFIRPEGGVGKFWLSHGGVQTPAGLYLFMSWIVDLPGDPTVWGFKLAGIEMAKVANPQDAAPEWKIQQRAVPFVQFDPGGHEITFGMPLLKEGNTVYLYGLEYDKASNNRYLMVARCPVDRLEDFSKWEFYADGVWQRDFRKSSRLCDHMGAELSVSYLPALKRYVAVYTENGLSAKIQMRLAETPAGPWGEPVTVYEAPEPGWDPSYFCYAAKAHPELARSKDELIVSYVCNSNDFGKLAADARIYFPKFIRIRFGNGEQHEGTK